MLNRHIKHYVVCMGKKPREDMVLKSCGAVIYFFNRSDADEYLLDWLGQACAIDPKADGSVWHEDELL